MDPNSQDATVVHRAIDKITKGLEWHLTSERTGNECQILCYEDKRRHHIRLPAKGPYNALDELHELCHAYLAEKVNPLFASGVFAKGVDRALAIAYGPAMNLAGDWFVEEIEQNHAPKQFKKELVEHLEWVGGALQNIPERDPEFICHAAMIFAQAMRYLNQRVEANVVPAELVQVFIDVDPSQPTMENLTRLANRLLPAFDAEKSQPTQVEWLFDGECHVWRFK